MDTDKVVDAVQSTAEASGKLAELAGKVGGFVSKVIGGASGQIGGILEDQLRYYRYKNLLSIADRVEAIHVKRRILGKTTPIPPRGAITMLESAALEDDETLQEVWARLIANSTDPNFKEPLHPSYIEVVKQMSSDDVIILESFLNLKRYPNILIFHIQERYDENNHTWWKKFTVDKAFYEAVYEAYLFHCKDLPLKQPSNVRMHLDNLQRLRLVELGFDFSGKERNSLHWLKMRVSSANEDKKNITIPARDEYLRMTTFGQSFIAACIRNNF